MKIGIKQLREAGYRIGRYGITRLQGYPINFLCIGLTENYCGKQYENG
jgi:hypothetical protein